MKKLLPIFWAIGILLSFYVVRAEAVPHLGVATHSAYLGESGQTGLEDYQSYFVDELLPGFGDYHGFAIDPTDPSLTVFTDLLGSEVWLLTTHDNQGWANLVTLDNGDGATVMEEGQQFDGYKPKPYYGISLGIAQLETSNLVNANGGSWYGLQDFPTRKTFLGYDVMIDPSGLEEGQYFFAVADLDKNLVLSPNSRGNGYVDSETDAFSPKTDSAVHVPEPATLLLLGSGFLGLAAFRRRKFLK